MARCVIANGRRGRPLNSVVRPMPKHLRSIRTVYQLLLAATAMSGCAIVPVEKTFYVPTGQGIVRGAEPYVWMVFNDERVAHVMVSALLAGQVTRLQVRIRPTPGMRVRLATDTLRQGTCMAATQSTIKLPDIPAGPDRWIAPTAELVGETGGSAGTQSPWPNYRGYSIDLALNNTPDCFVVELPPLLYGDAKFELGSVRFSKVTKMLINQSSPGT